MSSPTSPSLLLRIRDPNNQTAWQEFLSIYSGIVRNYCAQRHLQSADVDDVVQDVMLAVSKSIRNFEYDPSKGRFRSWLGTITANCIKAKIAQPTVRSVPAVLLPEGLENQSVTDPDDCWVSVFSEHIFRLACERIRSEFTQSTWDCFAASWIKNEASADIAARLSIPIHSVYVNKSRVLKRLETEVAILAEDVPHPLHRTDSSS